MEARMERRLEEMGRFCDCSTMHIGADPMNERVTNALHMMQDHLQQTRVISQRRSQKALTEQAVSKDKGQCSQRDHGGSHSST